MPTVPNPYPGPRPFLPTEVLYGREQETQQLLTLLLAERIVLLFSPSGAGKTSLLRAAVMPTLEQEGDFDVVPLLRVGADPAANVPPGANRYELSVLQTIESLAAEPRPPAVLIGLGLEKYLDARLGVTGHESGDHTDSRGSGETPEVATKRAGRRRRTKPSRPVNQVLVFDQFEEVLSADAANPDVRQALAARHEFFETLGGVLRNPHRWAVFSMREDHIGELHPFLGVIPTRLRTTYRLDLLGLDAARQAVRLPARFAGIPKGANGRPAAPTDAPPVVDFDEGAAQELVENLGQTRIPAASLGSVEAGGRYVEPLYLQVICNVLWDKLQPVPGSRIASDQIREYLDVDKVLAAYYDQTLEDALRDAVRARSPVSEAFLRRWIGDHLITDGRLRNQILEGGVRTSGMPAPVMRALIPRLVRADNWNGQQRFELLHDRLIEPVLRSNQDWEEKERLRVPLKAQAYLWEKAGRPRSGREFLPLRGEVLVEAQKWAEAHPDEVSDAAAKFLRLSKEAEATERETRNAIEAAQARAEAEAAQAQARAEAESARAEAAAARADRAIWERRRFSYLASIAFIIVTAIFVGLAYKAQRDADKARSDSEVIKKEVELAGAQKTARRTLVRQLTSQARDLMAHDRRLSGRLAAAALEIDQERQFDLPWNPEPESLLRQALAEPNVTPLDLTSGVEAVAFSPTKPWMVTAGPVAVLIWDVSDPAAPRVLQKLDAKDLKILTALFSPGGRWLVIAGETAEPRRAPVILYDTTRFDGPDVTVQGRELAGHKGVVTTLAFDPEGARLLTAGNDTHVLLWQLGSDSKVGEANVPIGQMNRPGPPLAKSANSTAIALDVPVTTKRILALGFHGSSVVAVSAENRVLIWDTAAPGSPRVLPAFKDVEVRAAAVSPKGRYAAAGNQDGALFLWDLNASPDQKPARFWQWTPNRVTAVAFDADEHWLWAGNASGQVFAVPPDPAVRFLIDMLFSNGLAGSGRGSLESASGEVKAIYSRGKDSAATVSGNGEVALWGVRPLTPILLRRMGGRNTRVLAVGMERAGRRLAIGASNDNVQLFDLAAREQTEPQTVQSPQTLQFPSSPYTPYILWFGSDGTVTLYMVNFESLLREDILTATYRFLDGRPGERPDATVTLNKDSYAAVFFHTPQEAVHDRRPHGAGDTFTLPTSSPVLPGTVIRPPSWPKDASFVLPSRGSLAFIFEYSAKKQTIWDRATGEMATLPKFTEPEDISPDGREWIVRSADDGFNVIDFSDLKKPVTRPWPLPKSGAGPAAMVRFLSGERVLVGRKSGAIQIFEFSAERPALKSTLLGHTGEVIEAALTPDGSRLVTSALDRTIRIWPLGGSTGPEEVLEGVVINLRTSSWGRNMAISFDSKHFALILNREDLRIREVKVWLVQPDDLLAAAEREFGRLKSPEWERFLGKEGMRILRPVAPDD